MNTKSVSIIVIGDIYTDLVLSGIENFVSAGKSSRAREFSVQAGGKARNMAQMAAILKTGAVAMVAKTSKDKFGLWQVPIDALKKANVNTKYVQILETSPTVRPPGMVIALVDVNGHHQLYGRRGIIDDFALDDIEAAESLFQQAQKNQGVVLFSCIIPLDSVLHGIKKANQYGLKVLVDPGGIYSNDNPRRLLSSGEKIFCLKPNEREAEVLTGVKVIDFKSAQKAADELLTHSIENVLITNGAEGAYLFNASLSEHIKIPKLTLDKQVDETGCGDQLMAALAVGLEAGLDVSFAAKQAVVAGTLQFHKSGVVPVTKAELERALKFADQR